MDSIEQMRMFAAVAATMSFSRAADRLGTSAQNVSKNIRALEDELGVLLLHRTTRVVTLTESGRAYLPRCNRLVEDFDEIRAAMRDEGGTPSGNLVVTAPLTFGEVHLLGAVEKFLAANPQVTLDLRLTDQHLSLIDEGIDLSIRIGQLQDSTLISRKLGETRLIACATPAYLDAHGTPAHPTDLTAHRCIFDTNRRASAQWSFRDGAEALSVPVNHRVRVNGASAVRQLILSGEGIGIVPSYIVDGNIRAGDLVPVLERYEGDRLPISILYLANRHLSRKVRAFIDIAEAEIRACPDWNAV
ncbi:LysR family transcriptional regulator [Nisaea acidiphila]|uniref:LysR family transcriptional regulator n=1 Tax=Nisaea acidiphila TaxID=1862145 RepID=A0A9J7AQI4_9PROT|nr:LysR family transcriptional regulator [Nisaea acidiphila]UUX48857.1 LysR family transcriptional regulator [Nisaea acidiphila]